MSFFFSLLQLQLHLYPQLLRRLLHCLPHPFPCCSNTTAASVASSYFYYGVADSCGNFAALSSWLLNFNYCYIFHTLRVLHAACLMLQAACCVAKATTTMWNAKWEMENCENAKCQMGNGANAVLVSKVIKSKLIDGCVFHCVPQLHLPLPLNSCSVWHLHLQLLLFIICQWQTCWVAQGVAGKGASSCAVCVCVISKLKEALQIPIQHSMECNYR